MEQEQRIENHDNDKQRQDQQAERKAIWTVTGTATAIQVFLITSFFLWVFIRDYVSPENSTTVFIESEFSLAIVIVVVIHAIMYYKQAKAMDAQLHVSNTLAQTALRQFEITDRPWLAVDVAIVGPLTFNEQGANITFRIVAKNVGRSVAVNATIHAKVVVPVWGGDVWGAVLEEQLQVCQNIDTRFMSYAIFPEDTYVSDRSFGIGPEDLERARLAGGDFRTDFFSLYLVGCVDYQFSGHESHHQTRFIYEVHRRDINNPNIWLALMIGPDVPAEGLILHKMIIGRGDYAD